MPQAVEEKPAPRILVVEDDPSIRQIILLMLKMWNWQGTTVECGEKALQACEKEPFDLVIMDLAIPDMDGFETTRQIRKLKRKATSGSVPIVALTAHVSRQYRDRCLQSGMNDYLAKPVRMDDLFSAIQRNLQATGDGGRDSDAI